MLYNDLIFNVSDMKNAVEALLADLCRHRHISCETKYNIKLVLNELIYNGLKYTDSGKGVKMMAKLKEEKIAVAIKDFGCGFDHRAVRDNDIKNDAAIYDEHGRGIYICSSVCDDFRYNRKGNIIAIKLNLV